MRKRTSVTIIALCILLGCSSGKKTTTPVEFKEFSAPDGKFSVLMPGTPEKKTQTIQGMRLVMYGVDVKDGAYVVGYADPQPGRPVSLPGAVQGVAGSHDGKVLSETDYSFEGNTGREFEVETSKPKGFVSGRVIVINGRFYQILAMGTNASLANEDVQKFLKSFKLSK
jgi:hypothetical protein